MSKRRASYETSRAAEYEDSDVDNLIIMRPRPSSCKKIKMDPEELCQHLYDIIRTFKKEDGSLLCNSFIRAPNRCQEPQYYEVVTQPIDLLMIEEKLKTDAYKYVDELSADLQILVNNTKAFYKPDSLEYKDAVDLWKLYWQNIEAFESGDSKTPKLSQNSCLSGQSDGAEDMSKILNSNYEEHNVFGELTNSEDSAGESDEERGDNEDSPYWKFLETVMNHLRRNGDPMSNAFWKLPSRSANTDYYNRIKTPMSLNQIKKYIRQGKYGTLSEVADDMNIMFENAKQYNQPTSKLYKDAVKLQKLMQQRVQELLDIVQSSSSDDESLSPVKSQVNTPRSRGRPTEIAERESNRVESGLRKFDHTNYITVKDIKPEWNVGSQDVEIKLENSLDDSSLVSPATPVSVGGNSNPHNPSMSSATGQERQQTNITPVNTNKKPKFVTGYILYSKEVRRSIIDNNPGSTFGKISRLVGTEWRSLSAAAKQSWVERAARCNDETAARLVDETTQSNDIKPEWTVGSQDVEIKLENSLDDSSLVSPATPVSVGGNSNPHNPSMSSATGQERQQTNITPVNTNKKPKFVTGYILYSKEVRRSIIANNPGSTFGEISRVVGTEWRSLSAAAKQSWVERAARCNDETAARLVDETTQSNVPTEMTYECLWDTCDYQFGDIQDCMEHCIGESGSNGHVQRHMTSRGARDEFPCMWRDCARVLKCRPPFPTLLRLLRHVRDLHFGKCNDNTIRHF